MNISKKNSSPAALIGEDHWLGRAVHIGKILHVISSSARRQKQSAVFETEGTSSPILNRSA